MFKKTWEFKFKDPQGKIQVIKKTFVGSDPYDAAKQASDYIDDMEDNGYELQFRTIIK